MCETRQAAIGVAITDAAASGLNRRQQIIVRVVAVIRRDALCIRQAVQRPFALRIAVGSQVSERIGHGTEVGPAVSVHGAGDRDAAYRSRCCSGIAA